MSDSRVNEYHKSPDCWRRYVLQQLDEPLRAEMDEHLLQCDDCLNIMMTCLEREEPNLPAVPDTLDAVDDQAMQLIRSLPDASPSQPEPARKKRSRVWTHPAFHYTVAAAVTLLLMSSGLFQQLTVQMNRFDAAAVERSAGQRTITEHLMDRTLHLLDEMKGKEEGGSRP